MYAAIITIIIILAVLLILVILIQNPKGGGLSGEFGTAGASQMFGVKRTGDLLEQVSWGLGLAIVILVLASRFVVSTPANDAIDSANIQKAAKTTTAPAAGGSLTPAATPAPATPAPAKK